MSHQLVLPRKDKFRETLLENVYYDLLRTYSNELDKEGSLLIVFGFSFADEHIESLTKKRYETPRSKLLYSLTTRRLKTYFLVNSEIIPTLMWFYSRSSVGLQKMNEIITSFLGGMK